MEGSAQESVGTLSSWLRCYRCWSQNLEVQLHYEGILKVDAETGEAVEPVEEVQEAVVQCLDCLHDQPHLSLSFYDEDGRRISRIEPVEDRWERMVTGTPWVASCTVTVDADQVESCSGPDAADSLAFAAFGDHGTREFFTHVRFHKHEDDRIVVHMLVELYARSSEEATEVLEQAARGELDDHVAGRGVAPAGVERRRAALSAPSSHRPAAARASISSRERPSSPSTSAVCWPSSGGAAAPRSRRRPQIGERHELERARGRVLDRRPWPGRPAAAAAASASGTERTLPDRARRRRRGLGSHSSAGRSPEAPLEHRHELASVLHARRRSWRSARRRRARRGRARAQSARNRPSLAAATAIRPDAVSKSW